MKNRYPTAEELYALELEARRLRAAEIARLARAGAAALRAFFKVRTKEFRHA
ncbi:MAG: RSP_7527 family protein [Burkholderiales bacterium]